MHNSGSQPLRSEQASLIPPSRASLVLATILFAASLRCDIAIVCMVLCITVLYFVILFFGGISVVQCRTTEAHPECFHYLW